MGAGYLVFTAALGALGWALLIAAAAADLGPTALRGPEPLAIALFAIVILAGRASAVRTAEGQVLALDAAFYVAAAVCVGSTLAAGLIAMALTIDAGARLVRAKPTQRQRGLGFWGGLCYVIFFGGATGALVLCVGWLFDLDSLYVLTQGTDVVVLVRLLVAGGVLVAAHYALQAVRVFLSGGDVADYLRRVAVVGAIAESALMPLAAIIVYVYSPDEPLRFALLGFTYVVINFAFNRIYATTMKLRRRVGDLETLNETSRSLAASLQTTEVLEAVALAVTRALPQASTMTLWRRDEEGALLAHRYRAADRSFERVPETQLGEPEKSVLESKRSQRSTSNTRDESEGSDHGTSKTNPVGAWIGVPLAFYGQVEGVLCAQTEAGGRFSKEDQSLLESIAGQAAVALKNAELYALAMVDGLTKLFVRRYFDARLREELLRSRRFETEFSVVMMDVDNFKSLNDQYGHLVGDRVLLGIADVIRSELRGVDTGARYGGEEISMILPRTPLVEAYNVAERIRRKIDELQIRGDARPISVSASFGIASYPESGAIDAEDLIRLADKALYRAKATGKNRVELYWPDNADSSDSTENATRLMLVDDSL